VATAVAAVSLVRQILAALLGTAGSDILVEAGRWAGYAVVGGAIVVTHLLLLRRGGIAQREAGRGRTLAVVADAPLREKLVAVVAHELPSATVRSADSSAPELAALLDGANVVIGRLADVLEGPLAGPLRAFGGHP